MGKGYIIESSREWNSADTLSIESCHAKCPQQKYGLKQFPKVSSWFLQFIFCKVHIF